MASSSIAVAGTAAEARQRHAVTDWWGGWRAGILTCLGFTGLFVGLAVYMHAFAWSAGIDATSPEFGLYWRNLLILELVGVSAGTLGWWAWLARSGRALPAAVTHDEEVRRIMVFWGLLGATCVVLYFMASFFVSADAAWHQTAVRDTAFTPPHIVLFYCAFPLGITMTVGTYLYGVTRLPRVYPATAGFPWSFFILIAASVTEMLQVALNEWGHSLWIAEEVFAAPLHWPFVIYVWLAAAMFALWLETLIRLLSIEKEIADHRTQAART
jgi:methane/ammonia monooxygenase subunit C